MKKAIVFIALLAVIFGCAAPSAGHDDLDMAIRDASALEIGKFLGAQTIVTGAISELADRHRMRIRALDVKATQVLQAV